MRSVLRNRLMALVVVAAGLVIGAGGIYLGDMDDAPGAALMGVLLMIGAFVYAVRILRRKV